MSKYIIKRILLLIPVLLGVSLVIFTIMYFVPGDPARAILGTANVTEEMLEAKRVELGLRDSFIIQFLRFLKQTFLDFDFGQSYITRTSVGTEIALRFPKTLVLAVCCMLLQIVIGIPLGIAAATHQNGVIDRVCILVTILGISLPQFWVALMLVMLFSLKLHWLPAFGYGGIQSLILPVVSLALNGISTIARLTRTSMLEVIRSDYVVTATAKGLSRRRVIFVHALPNSIIPVIQSLGTSFGGCLGGAVVIENIFSRLLYGARYSLAIGLQAQVINLLQDLQKEYGLTYMFVTHDLSVVHRISDEISVMYLGQLAETAASAALFERPLHPYTKALLSAIPSVDIHNQREQILIRGELTSPIDPAPGCRFALTRRRRAPSRRRCGSCSPDTMSPAAARRRSTNFESGVNRNGQYAYQKGNGDHPRVRRGAEDRRRRRGV